MAVEYVNVAACGLKNVRCYLLCLCTGEVCCLLYYEVKVALLLCHCMESIGTVTYIGTTQDTLNLCYLNGIQSLIGASLICPLTCIPALSYEVG